MNDNLTINEGAEILNVSKSFFLKLLDSGVIHSKMVGAGHYVPFDKLLEYKRKMHQERMEAMDELASLSQELG